MYWSKLIFISIFISLFSMTWAQDTNRLKPNHGSIRIRAFTVFVDQFNVNELKFDLYNLKGDTIFKNKTARFNDTFVVPEGIWNLNLYHFKDYNFKQITIEDIHIKENHIRFINQELR